MSCERSSVWPARSFLGQLTEEARQAALRLGTVRRFEPGEIVLQEGAPSDCAILLVSGLYKITGSMDSGREALVAIRAGGDLIGELGLADGLSRSATVRVIGPGTGRRIGERDFYAFLARFSEATRAVNRSMADKLRAATRRRVEFATYRAPVRIARVLLELYELYGLATSDGFDIGVELIQPELAALVGVGEATIHRILTGLRQDGVLETGYRHIRILDLDHLENLADG